MQKRWQKFTLLNIGVALGLFVSLFGIPKSTSILLLAVVFSAIVAAMNYALFVRLKRGTGGDFIKNKTLSTVITVLGVLIFLFGLIYRIASH